MLSLRGSRTPYRIGFGPLSVLDVYCTPLQFPVAFTVYFNCFIRCLRELDALLSIHSWYILSALQRARQCSGFTVGFQAFYISLLEVRCTLWEVIGISIFLPICSRGDSMLILKVERYQRYRQLSASTAAASYCGSSWSNLFVYLELFERCL